MSKHLYKAGMLLLSFMSMPWFIKIETYWLLKKKTVQSKEKILTILTVVCSPEEVAVSHYKGIKQQHTWNQGSQRQSRHLTRRRGRCRWTPFLFPPLCFLLHGFFPSWPTPRKKRTRSAPKTQNRIQLDGGSCQTRELPSLEYLSVHQLLQASHLSAHQPSYYAPGIQFCISERGQTASNCLSCTQASQGKGQNASSWFVWGD